MAKGTAKMEAQTIIQDNFEAKNDSFLYFLREKSTFKKDSFNRLCNAVRAIADTNVEISRNAQKITHIYGTILKCFMYHFDKNDDYKITDLPDNYNKMIALLDKNVEYYFATRI